MDRPDPAIGRPDAAIGHPDGAIGRSDTAIGRPDAEWAAAIEHRLDQMERSLKALQSLSLLVLASSAREVIAHAAQRLPDLWK